jgi:hypothetical protein
MVLFMASLVLLGCGLMLVLHFWLEWRRIRAFAIAATSGVESSAVKIALELAGVIHSRIPHERDPIFLPMPPFSSLGATPGSVLRIGGCCSGITRLYIVALQTLGIRAYQVTLYHESDTYHHCLAEVCLGRDKMLIDATYGFYYVDEKERPVSQRDLRKGKEPTFRKLPYSVNDSYPPHSIYRFNYRNTKTANWHMTSLRRRTYRVLNKISPSRIDYLKVPAMLEWPQIILLCMLMSVLLLLNLFGRLQAPF